MIRYVRLTIAATFLLLAACNNNASKTEEPKGNVHVPQIAGNSYFGVLPCASCPGIETSLFFNSDSTVVKETLYQDNDIFPEIEKGKYSVNGNIVSLAFPTTESNQKYLVKDNGQLAMLGENDQEVEGDLKEYYKLSKVETLSPQDANGEYVNGQEGKGYFDKLVVKQVKEDIYSVSISSGKAAKGCLFNGRGALKGNRITVNLSELNKDMKSKMTITFRDKKASVYTDTPDNVYDLSYFCGGGGSLIGSYTKK